MFDVYVCVVYYVRRCVIHTTNMPMFIRAVLFLGSAVLIANECDGCVQIFYHSRRTKKNRVK